MDRGQTFVMDPWTFDATNDPWDLALFVALLLICGPSPVVIPLAAWVTWYDHTQWWTALVGTFTEVQLMVCVFSLLAIVVYWVNGLLLLAVAELPLFARIKGYKIQKDRSFDFATMWKLCHNVLINQVFVIIPMGMVTFVFKKLTGFGPRLDLVPPSSRECVLHLVAFVLINEVMFYYGHRLLHHKSIYGKVHKIHHEFTSPIGLAAIYCHPFEMLVSNIMPLFGGCVLLSSHGMTSMLWIVFAILGTQTHHCGYHWPWLWFDHQPTFHDFHHKKFNCNFGNLSWLDWIHGTDGPWREHLASQSASEKKVA